MKNTHPEIRDLLRFMTRIQTQSFKRTHESLLFRDDVLIQSDLLLCFEEEREEKTTIRGARRRRESKVMGVDG